MEGAENSAFIGSTIAGDRVVVEAYAGVGRVGPRPTARGATDHLASNHRINAALRLLGHSDEATTLEYYVRDSFSDEGLFVRL